MQVIRGQHDIIQEEDCFTRRPERALISTRRPARIGIRQARSCGVDSHLDDLRAQEEGQTGPADQELAVINEDHEDTSGASSSTALDQVVQDAPPTYQSSQSSQTPQTPTAAGTRRRLSGNLLDQVSRISENEMGDRKE